MSQRSAKIGRGILALGRILLVAFALGLVLMLVLSEAKPRPIEVRITQIEPLEGGEALRVYGKVIGTWGFFKRGWGQVVTQGGVDLVAGDGRGYRPRGGIEELYLQNFAWPPNWFREELWLSETIARPVGFTQIRLFVLNRDGKRVLSPPVAPEGSLRVVELAPKDIRALAWFGKFIVPLLETPDSAKVSLVPD